MAIREGEANLQVLHPTVGWFPHWIFACRFLGHGFFSAGQTHAEELKTLKDSHSGMLNAQSAKDQFLGGFLAD